MTEHATMLVSKLAASAGGVLMLAAGAGSGDASIWAEHVGTVLASSGLLAMAAAALAKWAVNELSRRMGMIPGLATEVQQLTKLMQDVKAELTEERRLRRRDRKILRRLLDARDAKSAARDADVQERINELSEQVARHGARLEAQWGTR